MLLSINVGICRIAAVLRLEHSTGTSKNIGQEHLGVDTGHDRPARKDSARCQFGREIALDTSGPLLDLAVMTQAMMQEH
jgi:hypothetical protein